ncbi:hypothetical protein JAAARDRAFT_451637 [Jaapia argillacea MUCL 33604]|uniref:Uncharacterized protein n=1 Tax=Jaapia argillacea MUCL 33604 TaxID=933084 RepID=A0A067Q564_9AGAM|nr:hypothetical protein JAAARDRAFT_451637 [Jaapia argillacea MUCL 33604]
MLSSHPVVLGDVSASDFSGDQNQDDEAVLCHAMNRLFKATIRPARFKSVNSAPFGYANGLSDDEFELDAAETQDLLFPVPLGKTLWDQTYTLDKYGLPLDLDDISSSPTRHSQPRPLEQDTMSAFFEGDAHDEDVGRWSEIDQDQEPLMNFEDETPSPSNSEELSMELDDHWFPEDVSAGFSNEFVEDDDGFWHLQGFPSKSSESTSSHSSSSFSPPYQGEPLGRKSLQTGMARIVRSPTLSDCWSHSHLSVETTADQDNEVQHVLFSEAPLDFDDDGLSGEYPTHQAGTLLDDLGDLFSQARPDLQPQEIEEHARRLIPVPDTCHSLPAHSAIALPILEAIQDLSPSAQPSITPYPSKVSYISDPLCHCETDIDTQPDHVHPHLSYGGDFELDIALFDEDTSHLDAENNGSLDQDSAIDMVPLVQEEAKWTLRSGSLSAFDGSYGSSRRNHELGLGCDAGPNWVRECGEECVLDFDEDGEFLPPCSLVQ